MQSQNIQGREESRKHKSGLAGKAWLGALRAENLENGALVNGYLVWRDHWGGEKAEGFISFLMISAV